MFVPQSERFGKAYKYHNNCICYAHYFSFVFHRRIESRFCDKHAHTMSMRTLVIGAAVGVCPPPRAPQPLRCCLPAHRPLSLGHLSGFYRSRAGNPPHCPATPAALQRPLGARRGHLAIGMRGMGYECARVQDKIQSAHGCSLCRLLLPWFSSVFGEYYRFNCTEH
jgi:hypothetical protein